MSAPQTGIKTTTTPQVKICGITSPEDGLACCSLGADAIGLVFYPKSPRYVDMQKAADISGAIPESIGRVGVFVNAAYEQIIERVDACGLTAVQLHGSETADLAERLDCAGVKTIKTLFINKAPSLEDSARYPGASFIVECAGGALPGGNARAWDWGAASGFGETNPLVLAGGLSPENVSDAIRAADPDAVDVSSGVESAAGRKDHDLIRKFIHAVRSCVSTRQLRRIF